MARILFFFDVVYLKKIRPRFKNAVEYSVIR